MYVQTADQLFSLAMLLLCCGAAIWRGRTVERFAATAMVAAWFATPLVQNVHQTLGFQHGVLIVDALLLACLLTLALTSDRWWTMAATAFQGVAVMVHLAAAVDHHIIPRAYFIAGNLLGYLTMGALLVGAWNARRAGDRRLDRPA